MVFIIRQTVSLIEKFSSSNYLKVSIYDKGGWRHYESMARGNSKILHREEETLTKDELINAVVKSCKSDNLTKRLAGDVVDAAFESISKAIKKEKRFAYPSFGTFTVRSRKARKGRNPQTGEEIKIKASKTVGFKPAPTLKGSL